VSSPEASAGETKNGEYAGHDTRAMAELDGHPAGADELQALALTNYGHFTSMRVNDGRVRGLSLHLERLVRDCRRVFGADLDPERARDLVRRVADGRTGSFVVRVTVFDPTLGLGSPGASATPRLLVTTRPASKEALPPLRVRSCAYRRDLPTVKHVGLFNALHHRRAAQLAGFDDALFSWDGLISEGPTWNVGFVDGDRVIWPEADVLAGVTMTLLRRHRDHATAPVRLDPLDGIQAAFATNTSFGVRPISAIDAVDLPAEHAVFDDLRDAYASVPDEPLG